MARQSAPEELGTRLPSVAVLTASFLSGAMVSLSAITVPVLLDTNTHPAQLLRQWSRLYYYGHIVMPSMAVAATGLFSYLALQRRSTSTAAAATRQAKEKKHGPSIYVAAGAATIAIVPFTFLTMLSTNQTLFGLEKLASLAVGEQAEAAVDFSLVQRLVVKWAWLHVVRSVFPLVGAILGFKGLVQEIGQQ